MANKFWNTIKGIFSGDKNSNASTGSSGAGTAVSSAAQQSQVSQQNNTIRSYNSGIQGTKAYADAHMDEYTAQYNLARKAGVSDQQFLKDYGSGIRWLDQANNNSPAIRQYNSGVKGTREYAEAHMDEYKTQYNLARQAGISDQDFLSLYGNGTRWQDVTKPSITSYNSGIRGTKEYADEHMDEYTEQWQLAKQAGLSDDDFLRAYSEGTRWREEQPFLDATTGGGKEPGLVDKVTSWANDSQLWNDWQDRRMERWQKKYGNGVFADDFWGQTQANYGQAFLAQELNRMYNDLADNPDDEHDRQYISQLEQMLESYQIRNEKALDDKNVQAAWISKHMAGYAPQLVAEVVPAAGAAAVGLLVAGPAGAWNAYRVARTITSGINGYEVARGASYSSLIKAGASPDAARAAATDEAVISSIIEMGDTAVDLFARIPGLGKILGRNGEQIAVKTVGGILKSYGLNVAQEGAEEFFQEILSAANRERVMAGEGDSGYGGLIKYWVRYQLQLAKGEHSDELAQAMEAAKGGAIIGAVMGGAHLVGGRIQQGVNDRQVSSILQRIEENPDGLAYAKDENLEYYLKRAQQDGATKNENAAKLIQQELDTRNKLRDSIVDQNGKPVYRYMNDEQKATLKAQLETMQRDDITADKVDLLGLHILYDQCLASGADDRIVDMLSDEYYARMHEVEQRQVEQYQQGVDTNPPSNPIPGLNVPEAPQKPVIEEQPAPVAEEPITSPVEEQVQPMEAVEAEPENPVLETARRSNRSKYTAKQLQKMTDAQLEQELAKANQLGDQKTVAAIEKELDAREEATNIEAARNGYAEYDDDSIYDPNKGLEAPAVREEQIAQESQKEEEKPKKKDILQEAIDRAKERKRYFGKDMDELKRNMKEPNRSRRFFKNNLTPGNIQINRDILPAIQKAKNDAKPDFDYTDEDGIRTYGYKSISIDNINGYTIDLFDAVFYDVPTSSGKTKTISGGMGVYVNGPNGMVFSSGDKMVLTRRTKPTSGAVFFDEAKDSPEALISKIEDANNNDVYASIEDIASLISDKIAAKDFPAYADDARWEADQTKQVRTTKADFDFTQSEEQETSADEGESDDDNDQVAPDFAIFDKKTNSFKAAPGYEKEFNEWWNEKKPANWTDRYVDGKLAVPIKREGEKRASEQIVLIETAGGRASSGPQYATDESGKRKFSVAEPTRENTQNTTNRNLTIETAEGVHFIETKAIAGNAEPLVSLAKALGYEDVLFADGKFYDVEYKNGKEIRRADQPVSGLTAIFTDEQGREHQFLVLNVNEKGAFLHENGHGFLRAAGEDGFALARNIIDNYINGNDRGRALEILREIYADQISEKVKQLDSLYESLGYSQVAKNIAVVEYVDDLLHNEFFSRLVAGQVVKSKDGSAVDLGPYSSKAIDSTEFSEIVELIKRNGVNEREADILVSLFEKNASEVSGSPGGLNVEQVTNLFYRVAKERGKNGKRAGSFRGGEEGAGARDNRTRLDGQGYRGEKGNAFGTRQVNEANQNGFQQSGGRVRDGRNVGNGTVGVSGQTGNRQDGSVVWRRGVKYSADQLLSGNKQLRKDAKALLGKHWYNDPFSSNAKELYTSDKYEAFERALQAGDKEEAHRAARDLLNENIEIQTLINSREAELRSALKKTGNVLYDLGSPALLTNPEKNAHTYNDYLDSLERQTPPHTDEDYRETYGKTGFDEMEHKQPQRTKADAIPRDVTAEEREFAAQQDYEQSEQRAEDAMRGRGERMFMDYGKKDNAWRVFNAAMDITQRKFGFDTKADEDMTPDDKAKRKAMNSLREAAKAVAEGRTSGYEFAKFLQKAQKDYRLGQYLNGDTEKYLFNAVQNVVDAYEDAVETSSPAAVGRYAHETERAIKMLSKRMERWDLADRHKTTLGEEADRTVGLDKRKSRRKARFNQSGETFADSAANFLTRMQINPTNVFRGLFGGWNKYGGSLGYQISEQQDNATRVNQSIISTAQMAFLDVRKMKGFQKFAQQKDIKAVNLMGGTMNLSQQQIVGMYKTVRTLLADQRQSVNQISIQDEKGKTQTLYSLNDNGEAIPFNREDLRDMQRTLWENIDEVGKAYLDVADDILEDLGGRNADAEEATYGYRPRTYKKGDYIPLRYVTDGKGGGVSDDTIQFKFTQERTRKAGGTILVEPVTATIDRYINQSANHIAYAELGDQLALMNRPDTAGRTLTEIMKENYGEQMGQWMTNYVSDMNNFNPKDNTDGVSTMLRKGRQAVQTGALVGSVSVPMKQISSYWAAAGKLRMSTLRKAYRIKFVGAKSKGTQNPLLYYRKVGGIDPTMSEIMNSDGLWAKMRNKSKILQAMEKSIPTMDFRTIDNLYTACVLEVKEDNPRLDVKSEKFQQMVNDKFEDVVISTQPIFTRNARAEYARTNNEFIKMFSMFRTQQTQNLNRIMQAIGEAKASKGTLGEFAAQSELGETIKGQAASALSLSLLTVLADTVLHKLKKYKDKDDEIDPEKVMERIGLNAIEAGSGTVWFADSALKFAIDTINKAQGKSSSEFYGVNMGIVSTIGNAAEAIGNLAKNPTLSNLQYTAGYISQAMGIPLSNAYRMINGAIAWTRDVAGHIEGDDKPGEWDDILRYLDSEVVIHPWGDNLNHKVHVMLNAESRGNDQKAERIFSELPGGDKVDSAIRSDVKSRVLDGSMSTDESEYVLGRYTGMEEENIQKKNDFWEFLRDNPAYDSDKYSISESFVQHWNNEGKPANIPLNRFYECMMKAKNTSSIDVNGDGKANGKGDITKQQQLIEYINGLALTKEQKDALWVAFGYKTTSEAFKKRPWR